MEPNAILEKNLEIIEKLANGMNPVDDTMLPEDSPINNIDVTRALYFALTSLKTEKKKASRRKDFYIEEDKLANFEFVQDGAYLSQIVEKLNQLIDVNKVKMLSRSKMVRWLVNIGILTTVQTEGRKAKRHMPTEQGLNMGLKIVQLVDRFGTPFDAVKYPVSMQKFILDNLDGFYNWVVNNKR